MPTFGELSLMENLKALNDAVAMVQRGDLNNVEATLVAQVVALNAIFHAMAMRAHSNIQAGYLNASDRFLRLALKAQSQSRATVEAIAALKNPQTIIARQANIAHGPQQVNNTVPPATKNPESDQDELMEAQPCERVDAGATQPAVQGDPALAPMGVLHRSPHA